MHVCFQCHNSCVHITYIMCVFDSNGVDKHYEHFKSKRVQILYYSHKLLTVFHSRI